jgi:tripartite ATP-independent transporter DctP family solute receptor
MLKTLMGSVAALAIAFANGAANAADKVEIIYSDTVQETDVRTTTLRAEFGACLGGEFDFKSFHGATLFKQGTELNAMQRGNLDMANLAIFDFYNQVPETSLLGTPYLFRDPEHMAKVMSSDVVAPIWKAVEDKAQVKVLTSPYIGTRHLNLKGDKKITTPADLAGVKLRMPGGEGWQFAGEALGANPTPMAFTEVYTGLQTGAIDAQDNPLPADKSMKFYEVTNQIVLTAHFIANNQFSISMRKWNSLTPEQQTKVSACAENFNKKLTEVTLKQEAELVDFFKAQNLKVYEPDREAFRKHVLDYYKKSKYSADWPEGMIDKIGAL